MPTNIYTTQEKLNETLDIDGIVPEMTNEWFKDIFQPQDPQWGYQVGEMNSFYGKKHTDEYKLNHSKIFSGRPSNRLGTKHSGDMSRFGKANKGKSTHNKGKKRIVVDGKYKYI